MKYYLAVLLLFLELFAAGCGVHPRTGQNELAVTEVTTAQEIALGEQAYTQALQKLGGLYPDVQLNDYIDRVGQRVARASHRSGLTYHFNIVNNSTANVFALPGGYVAITRGLLVALENEAQLAAVLAHAVGHIAARHSVQELRRSRLLKTSPGLVANLAGGDDAARRLNQVGVLTTELLAKRYSPEQEYEADRLGVDSLAAAGYGLQGVVGLQQIFLDKLEAGQDSAGWRSGMFQTHPFSRERLLAIQARITSVYGDNASREGLDSSIYMRQLVGLQGTRKAYELYDQALSLETEGRVGEAIEIYHQAMQQAPDHGLLLTALGMAYLRGDDLVPARRYLRKAVASDPQYYQSRMGLAYLQLQSRQYLEASQQLQLATTLLATVEGIYLLAQAEEGQGHGERARTLYQMVVDSDPLSRIGRAAAARLQELR
jgi:predicted Zn-dependent protease